VKSYLLEGRPFISLCSFQGTRALRLALWRNRAGIFRESLKTEQWQGLLPGRVNCRDRSDRPRK
jgi:hypothetical protein